ncbi:hypothetical protein SAMN05660691_02425 [Rheinheimera pacifica]|uniref:Uncharacterized protein n=1 Tax=Rheinheimera pacifica TaxID=173990 RepID=A0A1H6M379_9GAMM|nr:hypothetical protein [Rheinheimera pacifica]SEH95656.1 hypothetical protein SAMN05660691_02425 [Rheinheimera pacifica]
MNRIDLKEKLEQESVKSTSFSLEAKNFDPDEALCLRQEGSGWVVYYSERGLQTGKQNFKSESEACFYILRELLADPTSRKGWTSGFNV